MNEQIIIANSTKEFLKRFGLKAIFVADSINVKQHIFSKFLCGTRVLTSNQLARLQAFISDYENRMS